MNLKEKCSWGIKITMLYYSKNCGIFYKKKKKKKNFFNKSNFKEGKK